MEFFPFRSSGRILETSLFWKRFHPIHNFGHFLGRSRTECCTPIQIFSVFLDFLSFCTHCSGQCTLVPYTSRSILKLGVSGLIDPSNRVYEMASFDCLFPSECKPLSSESATCASGLLGSTFDITRVHLCTCPNVIGWGITVEIYWQSGTFSFPKKVRKIRSGDEI